MTLEEQKRLAEIVTKNPHIAVPGHGVYAAVVVGCEITPYPYGKEFSPSLSGEDWQKAQALDVIVAALNHKNFLNVGRCNGLFHILYDIPEENTCEATDESDILSAAIQALLAKEGE